MKTTCLPFYLIILFCLFTFPQAVAQNWQPINKNYTYNYLFDNQLLPVYSIKVDSVSLNSAGDSVYHLNKVFKECKNCQPGNINLENRNYQYFQKLNINQNQFLLSEMIFSGNGNFSFFAPSSQVSIDLKANNNSPWQFDFTNNINADVIKENDTTIFGTADSVKQILLSSGDIVMLSKNHGILQFPSTYGSKKYYTLAGINEKNAGLTIPGFSEIFNFEIGDKFEYHDTSGSHKNFYGAIRQYTITGKSQLADTLAYTYEGHIRENGKGKAYSGILKYPHPLLKILDERHHELILKKQPMNLKTFLQFDTLGISYNNTFNSYTKIWHVNNASTLLKPFNDSAFILNLMLATDGDDFTTEFGPGLGIVLYQFASVGSGEISKLVAHKNGKRTIGTFTSVSEILSVNEDHKKINNWNIYPNPATSIISITNSLPDNNVANKFSYQLYTLQGKEILSAQSSNDGKTTIINIENFPKGIYFLKIHDKNQTITRKIIKN